MPSKSNDVSQINDADPLMSFETALERLEAVVRELEVGNAPLDRGLKLFEEGVALLHSCRKTLEAAELRIREFADVDETGAVRLKDFEHRKTTSPGGRE